MVQGKSWSHSRESRASVNQSFLEIQPDPLHGKSREKIFQSSLSTNLSIHSRPKQVSNISQRSLLFDYQTNRQTPFVSSKFGEKKKKFHFQRRCLYRCERSGGKGTETCFSNRAPLNFVAKLILQLRGAGSRSSGKRLEDGKDEITGREARSPLGFENTSEITTGRIKRSASREIARGSPPPLSRRQQQQQQQQHGKRGALPLTDYP